MATNITTTQPLKRVYFWYQNLKAPKTWCLADMIDGFVLAEGTFTDMMNLMYQHYDETLMVVETRKLPKGFD